MDVSINGAPVFFSGKSQTKMEDYSRVPPWLRKPPHIYYIMYGLICLRNWWRVRYFCLIFVVSPWWLSCSDSLAMIHWGIRIIPVIFGRLSKMKPIFFQEKNWAKIKIPLLASYRWFLLAKNNFLAIFRPEKGYPPVPSSFWWDKLVLLKVWVPSNSPFRWPKCKSPEFLEIYILFSECIYGRMRESNQFLTLSQPVQRCGQSTWDWAKCYKARPQTSPLAGVTQGWWVARDGYG